MMGGTAYVGLTRDAPLARFAVAAVTAVLLLLAAGEAWILLSSLGPYAPGLDFTMYQDRTVSWLAGEGFYRPHQLAGPYLVEHGDALYPPVLLALTVPFALGLPAILWWAIPLGIIAVSLRPAWWAWPLLAALLVYPRTWTLLLYGNPSLWALAAIAAGTRWRWPAALVPLKLTLAPFALLGARDRHWWIVGGVALALCLPMAGDWIAATVNARTGGAFGLDYLLGEWPIAIALVVAAWSGRLGTTKRPRPVKGEGERG